MKKWIAAMRKQRKRGCRVLAAVVFVLSFISYLPWPTAVKAMEYEIEYNESQAYHYDGSPYKTGQWYGAFLVGGYLFSSNREVVIRDWNNAHVSAQLPISLTNFSIPEVGVKLRTTAYCLRPSAPNYPVDIKAYEITPEVCNDFADVAEHKIDERDIDALNIAMDTLGLKKDGVHVSNETYAAMRFVCWYVSTCGWKSKDQFMKGIGFVKDFFNTELINRALFVSVCSKTADAIETSVGAPDTGYTQYMPAFAGRYKNQAPVIVLLYDEGTGIYAYTYLYSRKYDNSWEFSCPAGITVEYGADSVTFKSETSDSGGMIIGTVKSQSRLEGIVPSGGILVCKSDDPETQDMLLPYNSRSELSCYARVGGANGNSAEFPTLPDIEYCRYDETFEAHYTIEAEKYDAETGMGLKEAGFEILEKSPASQPEELNQFWGSQADIWNGWRRCSRQDTGEDGNLTHCDTRTYDYVGTYCKGHDDQEKVIEDYESFIEQCERENAEAGEGEDEEEDGEDAEPIWDTEAMREHLGVLQDGYELQIEACREFTADPEHHFFHSESGLDEQKSEMEQDRQDAYDQFVNLEYDYTIREIRSRSGYALHGDHEEDLPVSIIRTASSESGKESFEVNPDQRTGDLVPPYKDADGEAAVVGPGRDSGYGLSRLLIQKQSALNFDYFHKVKENPEQAETEAEATPSEAGESRLYNFMRSRDDAEEEDTGDDEGSYTVQDWEPVWERAGAVKTNLGAADSVLFSWRIDDHRVEGEVHINKRDRELLEGAFKNADFNSYGDTQGDATLEGAVYGLYAAQNLEHPDGKTGKIFSVNELVAQAATDIHGDASFLAVTEGIWAGHPLFLGRYYVKEIARSEGYELSVTGNDDLLDTNYGSEGNTEADNGSAFVNAVLAGGGNQGTDGSIIEVHTENVRNGVDLCLYHYPEHTKFGIIRTGTDRKLGQAVVGWNEKNVYEDEAGIRVYRNDSGTGRLFYRWDFDDTLDKYIRYEADRAVPVYRKYKAGELKKDINGNVLLMRDAAGNIQYSREPETKTVSYINHSSALLSGVEIPTDIENVRNTANRMLKEAGYSMMPFADRAPWMKLKLIGKTKQEQTEEVLEWFMEHPFYNAAQVQSVGDQDGNSYALLRFDYVAPGEIQAVLYGETMYVRERFPDDARNYYYTVYKAGEYTIDKDMETVFISAVRRVSKPLTVDDAIEDYIEQQYLPLYEIYESDTVVCDHLGKPVPEAEAVLEISENMLAHGIKTVDYLDDAAKYNEEEHCFTIHIRPERLTDAEKNGMFLIETEHPGMTSMKVNGQILQVGEYLKYVLDVTASASAASEDWTGTYIRDVMLPYAGADLAFEDQGTRIIPINVRERIIRQKVKINKDAVGMQESEEDQSFGMDNFRFQIYLRSNLERLYRDEQGNITWTDRNGDGIDILDYRRKYPADVPDIFTRTLHQNVPLKKNSNEAALANDELYSRENGFLLDRQNSGFTRILEIAAEEDGKKLYNYKKFFDAVWITGSYWQENTSAKPQAGINKINTSEMAEHNAKVSDGVRQFAVTWYLEEEVKKLKVNKRVGIGAQPEVESYGDSLYDRALYKAIAKAQNYLKPFFLYDLDEIYAIDWDSAVNAGMDGNLKTLSADTWEENSCSGLSKYLPYGIYVIVEQQPYRADLKDFKNRHYQIDEPKEITLPSVYENMEKKSYDRAYLYDSSLSPNQLIEKFSIRFCEEGDGGGPDEYVQKAHNRNGDFEIYKYGLDFKRAADHFILEQEEFRPEKEYYKTQADGTNLYYLPNQTVSAYYRYASVSEHMGTNGRKTMQGVQTAYEGIFAPMLVPWSVTGTGEGHFHAEGDFRNRFYRVKLRIEKLDADTGENILHDAAVFAIYKAKRMETEDGNGQVCLYDRDTVITGSKGFLEAMKARNITSLARGKEAGQLYSGIVPSGTPVCKEEDQILQADVNGRKTGDFKAQWTVRDGLMASEESWQPGFEEQNAGYLETLQPLGAGVYVLAELEPPAGYERSGPVAVEIYSDKVVYYLDGNHDNRVTAVIYKSDTSTEARIYFNNSPLVLLVDKVKSSAEKTRYQVGGRVEGTVTELVGRFGLENLEFAYNSSGKYLGYGWKKGTIEELYQRKMAGEEVEFEYEQGVFAGYGYVTRRLATADNKNRYVAGAALTLYDAVQIARSGDSQDFAFEGVNVERDRNSNVTGMYVRKGYAGKKTLYTMERKEEEAKGPGAVGNGIWTAAEIERGNTPILYFDLGNLKVFERDLEGELFGYDKQGKTVRVKDSESVYAVKNNRAFLEITGGDLQELEYSGEDRAFMKWDTGTVIYHLDQDGQRDAVVDPYTGMVYVRQKDGNRPDGYYVWPVRLSKAPSGGVIAREKIKTVKPAAINADTESEYVTGTWNDSEKQFEKVMEPEVNRYGLPVYYRMSRAAYKKGENIYDRDGDFVRYKEDENLDKYDKAAYAIQNPAVLQSVNGILHHRRGEALLMDNTWISGERFPNDPTREEVMTEANDPYSDGVEGGHEDRLKRVEAGTYIMEEIRPPDGYVKGMPKAVKIGKTVTEDRVIIEDEIIKVEISKNDQTSQYRFPVIDRDTGKVVYIIIEGKGSYMGGGIEGAGLELYRAKRVMTADWFKHPNGYYLEKSESLPVKAWITAKVPWYTEGLLAGDYILEEVVTPEYGGYIRNSIELYIRRTGEVQSFVMEDDHTKVEFMKYYVDETGVRQPMPESSQAELSLYQAVTDEKGEIVLVNHEPQYDLSKKVETWTTGNAWKGFAESYETMYREYGREFDYLKWENDVPLEKSAKLISSQELDKTGTVRQIWKTDEGRMVRICIYKNGGRNGFDDIFEYQMDYKKLGIFPNAVSYMTGEGNHRIDYLPFNTAAGTDRGNYVLVETGTPAGFQTARPKAVVMEDVEYVQMYSVENQYKSLVIAKTDGESQDAGVIKGAQFALYKSKGDGSLAQDELHLVNAWKSGMEGRYTEEDLIGNRIPGGLFVGGLKAHTISRIPYGSYYLVELKSPAGYSVMNPLRIEVDGNSQENLNAVNHMAKGRVKIYKSDAEDSGQMLAGARFEIRNRTTGEINYVTTGENGLAFTPWLDIGKAGNNGYAELYQFSIEEISAPLYHQVDKNVRIFTFHPDGGEEQITYRYHAVDKSTEIQIGKQDFDSGLFVEGAQLAVYGAKMVENEYRKDGDAIERWISDGGKHRIDGKLTAGRTYMLVEELVPDGYSSADAVLFTISDDGRKISGVSDQFQQLSFETDENDTVNAVTVTGRKALSVHALLTDMDSGRKFRWLCTGDGKLFAKADGAVAGARYVYEEYTSYSDGNEALTGRLTYRMPQDIWEIKDRVCESTRLTVSTLDGTTIDSWVVGAHDGGLVHTVLNPEEGAGHRNFMKGGVYLLTETTAWSDGGELSTARLQFIINEDCNITDLTMLDRSTQITVSKMAAARTGELPGAQLKVTDQDGNIVEEWISQMEPHRFVGKLKVGTTYTLTEITPPDGFGYAAAVSFEVNEEGVEERVMLINEPTNIEISKIDITDRRELAGARMQIRERNGSVVDQWISTDVPHKIIGKLLAGRSYTLIELSPPNGYGQAAELDFTVGEGSEIKRICMEDRPTNVKISKVNIANQNELSGAHLKICTKDGEIIEEWVSTAKPHTMTGKLKAGETYTISETAPPPGYDKALEIDFTVSMDGSPDSVRMEDMATRTEVSKVDNLSGRMLSGAKLEIRDTEGKVAAAWVSAEEPYLIAGILNSGETYRLVEIEAPVGYAKATDLLFKVKMENGVCRVEMRDEMLHVTAEKENWEGKGLEGAVLQIADLTGKVVEIWISDGKPHEILGPLKEGEVYRLEETKAPFGYYAANPIEFVAESNLKLVMIDLQRSRESGSEKQYGEIIKKGEDGERLSDAQIAVFREDESLFMTGATGKRGELWFELPPAGTYHYKEVRAPKGYELSEKVCYFTVDSRGAVKGQMVMEDKLEPQIPVEKNVYNDPEGENNQKIGRVLASYTSSLSGECDTSFGSEDTYKTGAKTGDDKPFIPLLFLILIGTGGLIGTHKKGNRNRNRGG